MKVPIDKLKHRRYCPRPLFGSQLWAFKLDYEAGNIPPIIIDEQYYILDGAIRVETMKVLGVKEVDCHCPTFISIAVAVELPKWFDPCI